MAGSLWSRKSIHNTIHLLLYCIYRVAQHIQSLSTFKTSLSQTFSIYYRYVYVLRRLLQNTLLVRLKVKILKKHQNRSQLLGGGGCWMKNTRTTFARAFSKVLKTRKSSCVNVKGTPPASHMCRGGAGEGGGTLAK